MSHFLQIALNVVLSLFGCAFLIWLLVRSIKNSEDPAKTVFKWLFTVALVTGEIFLIRHLSRSLHEGGPVANFGPALFLVVSLAAVGITLSIVWTPQISELLSRPLGSLFDGGNVPPEPKPFYSIAHARRKANQPLEAVVEIRKQLAKFPDDYEGINLLAAIQAEDLKDLPGAEITLNHFADSPGAPPKQVAAALFQLADWHLKLARDADSARAALEKVIAKFPNTDLALAAAQRLAHLGGTKEILLAARDRRPVAVPEGPKSPGLRDSMADLRPAETDPARQAAAWVKHLEQHPLDAEAREKLAVIYADHYHRLDLAAGELNQLIQIPEQPPKHVAHWLNLLADLQVRSGADYDTVRATLERIIERFPGSVVAERAQSRLNHLRLELKGQKETPDIKPGVYEQNIGLKGRSPHRL